MSPDLLYLTLTAGLCAVLWLPQVAGTMVSKGSPKAEDYKLPPTKDLPGWVLRAGRMHSNLVEALPAFAALVLVAHVTDTANATTAAAAAIFFWARIVHAVVYLLGVPYVRTLAFVVGVFAQLTIFWQIVA